jgi:hypothetical protein
VSAKTLYGVFWHMFHLTSDKLRCDEVRGSVVVTRAGPRSSCSTWKAAPTGNPIWVDRPWLIGEDGLFHF